MTTVRVEHRLGREGARQRFEALARKHGIAVESSDGGFSGAIERPVPFVGSVRAEFAIEDAALELRIVRAPAFPSAETIRRMVSDELSKALAS
jgi:hypothetical protein